MPVIDIHTHMLSENWVSLIEKNGAPDFAVGKRDDGMRIMIEDGQGRMTFEPEMFDYDMRLKDMDAEGIDISVVSLTSPSVFWGGSEISTQAARTMNDNMRDAQTAYPDRIRYLASLPWQYPDLAVAELARACDNGAVGVMALANVRGMHLTDPFLAPIWQAIDDRALPVLVHPTTPPGAAEMDLNNVGGSIPFLIDTTLAFTRIAFDGFLDRYPKLKLIAGHGGGTVPYCHGRMDLFWAQGAGRNRKIEQPPSDYLKRVYYDAVVYQADSLQQCINLAGADHVLFGTDYPHPTDVPGLIERAKALPGKDADAVLGGAAMKIFDL